MTIQFTKCQEAELARMEFFKAIFFKMEAILDLTKTNRQVLIVLRLLHPDIKSGISGNSE